jgi:hypothetical protein
MPAISAPYGFRPVRTLGNRPYNGSTNMYRIQSGTAANLFYGDPLALSGGFVVKATTGFANYIGVFQGCQYTDPTMGLLNRQYWPSGTVASDAIAYVADDPDLIFQVQCVNASYNALADVGLRIDVSLPASPNDGNTATGLSKVGITNADAVDGEVVLLGIVNEPNNINGSGYVDCLVTVAGGLHVSRNQYIAP